MKSDVHTLRFYTLTYR